VRTWRGVSHRCRPGRGYSAPSEFIRPPRRDRTNLSCVKMESGRGRSTEERRREKFADARRVLIDKVQRVLSRSSARDLPASPKRCSSCSRGRDRSVPSHMLPRNNSFLGGRGPSRTSSLFASLTSTRPLAEGSRKRKRDAPLPFYDAASVTSPVSPLSCSHYQ